MPMAVQFGQSPRAKCNLSSLASYILSRLRAVDPQSIEVSCLLPFMQALSCRGSASCASMVRASSRSTTSSSVKHDPLFQLPSLARPVASLVFGGNYNASSGTQVVKRNCSSVRRGCHSFDAGTLTGNRGLRGWNPRSPQRP